MPYNSLLDKLKIILTTSILRIFYTFIELYNLTFMFIRNIVKLFDLIRMLRNLLLLYRIKIIANFFIKSKPLYDHKLPIKN